MTRVGVRRAASLWVYCVVVGTMVSPWIVRICADAEHAAPKAGERAPRGASAQVRTISLGCAAGCAADGMVGVRIRRGRLLCNTQVIEGVYFDLL